MLDPKKQQLHITLTEPTVYLRSSDPSGRLQPDPNDPPTLVRGLLNLHVVKPIDISSIQVELTGALTLRPPEEIGSRRTDLPETLRVYSSAVAVFRADQVHRRRRPSSVGPGPGLSTANINSDNQYAITNLPRPPSPLRRRSGRRSSVSLPPDPGPTPPYTTVAQPQILIQPRLYVPVENSAQTLEELRQAARNSSEGQAHQDRFATDPTLSHPIESSLPNPTTQSSVSSSSNHSLHREDPPFEGDSSPRNNAEEPQHIPPHRGLIPSRSHSPGNTHGTDPHTRLNIRDSSNTPAGRSRLHLSLSSVLDTVMEVASRGPSRSRSVAEERERGRTRVRIAAEEQSRGSVLEAGEGVAGTEDDSQLGTNSYSPSRHMEHREHHLLGLGRVLGLEREREEKNGERRSREHREGWREFKPGTYNYPISFLLPPDLPPTLSVPHGSLSYVIRAVAHRPGAFTSKLSCQVPLTVVATPAIGAGDDSRDLWPLSVQKQWEGKLVYSFGLSSRLFLLGSQRHLETAASEGNPANPESIVETGVEARAEETDDTVTLDLTLLPVEKIKIWRLDVVIDQCIKYADERGKLFGDDKKRVRLLELQDKCSAEELDVMDEEQAYKNKHKNKPDFTQIPLLPTPISPHRSPLLRYVPPSAADPSTLAGPGPYTLSIRLPGFGGPSGGARGLHFTVKQKSSSVKVEHSLRLVMRVECVGDEGTDSQGVDKKKLFDISVQTPITILSGRCVSEYQTLPTYSQIVEDGLQNPAACACHPSAVERPEQGHAHEIGNHLVRAMTSNSTSSSGSEDEAGHSHRPVSEQHSGHEHARSSSSRAPTPRSGGLLSPLTTPLQPPSPSPTAGGRTTRGLVWRRSSAHAQAHLHGQHHRSGSQSCSVSTSHVRSHSQTPISTPHASRPPSPLARYERLVSGSESAAGDAPPSYDSITSGF